MTTNRKRSPQQAFGFRTVGTVDELGIVHARRTIIRRDGEIEVDDLDWRRTTAEEDEQWEAEASRIVRAQREDDALDNDDAPQLDKAAGGGE